MKTYAMTITQQDGAQLRYLGLYSVGFIATIDAIETFPTAKRICARRLP